MKKRQYPSILRYKSVKVHTVGLWFLQIILRESWFLFDNFVEATEKNLQIKRATTQHCLPVDKYRITMWMKVQAVWFEDIYFTDEFSSASLNLDRRSDPKNLIIFTSTPTMNSHNFQQLYIFYKKIYIKQICVILAGSFRMCSCTSVPLSFFSFLKHLNHILSLFCYRVRRQNSISWKNTQSKKQTQWHFRKLHRISLYPVPLQDRNLPLCLMVVWMLWWNLPLIASHCSSAGFCFERKGLTLSDVGGFILR